MSGNDSTRNIRLLVEYNGTSYAGWQLQESLPTIQGCLLDAFEKLIAERPTLQVAGRTDAGVHAIGQVASFRTNKQIPLARIAPGLNNYLPNDITIHEATEMPTSFDARVDSKSKRYGYRVYTGPQPAALELDRAWQMRDPLDAEVMIAASQSLVGHRDFESFRSAHCDAPHAIRRIYAIEVTRYERPPRGEHIQIIFHANAFCRHMCRIMAGTLIEVGRGKREPASVAAILEARDRTRAGMTAPACGLTLLEVLY